MYKPIKACRTTEETGITHLNYPRGWSLHCEVVYLQQHSWLTSSDPLVCSASPKTMRSHASHVWPCLSFSRPLNLLQSSPCLISFLAAAERVTFWTTTAQPGFFARTFWKRKFQPWRVSYVTRQPKCSGKKGKFLDCHWSSKLHWDHICWRFFAISLTQGSGGVKSSLFKIIFQCWLHSLMVSLW